MYLIFAGDDYEASGGWNDLKGIFSDRKSARKVYLQYYKDRDWVQLIRIFQDQDGAIRIEKLTEDIDGNLED